MTERTAFLEQVLEHFILTGFEPDRALKFINPLSRLRYLRTTPGLTAVTRWPSAAPLSLVNTWKY